jgi:short-subunit dehydrogenase
MRIGLVTGASAGLGACFARQIAADDRFDIDELWLVARRVEPMQRLCADLPRVRGVALRADLSTPGGLAVVTERLERERPDLRILINNAGFALHGRFADLDEARQLEMIDLNVRALTQLTYRGLRCMGQGGLIVQVASVLGMIPAAGWSVYSATKAYVIHLSVGLAGELEARGIRCTVCCPGPMATEFYDVAGSSERLPLYIDPEAVAALALRHVRAGKLVSVKGAAMKSASVLSRLLPRGAFIWGTKRRLD